MKHLFLSVFMLSCLFLTSHPLHAEEGLRHDLKVVLHPEDHRYAAEDTITIGDGYGNEWYFQLHKGMAPSSRTPGVLLERVEEASETVLSETYRVMIPNGRTTFVIKFGGTLYHPLEAYGKEYARGFRQTPGMISEEGVYLAGSSYWYPRSRGDMVTFSLEVTLPQGWDALSQGERTLHVRDEERTIVRWDSPEPQEDIYLVAGRFSGYVGPAGRVKAMVFLRSPDEELAGTYLDATSRYLALYENLIGKYPYKKFALVENFWETGFGMPSFTLLGPKVIRFPFILHSSYPHEILHSWWGNSVMPDYAKGNWSEGLTAYLSDHLIKEQRGRGAEYRKTTLQKYADYVKGGRDFPLTRFHARHSSSSEAIGYGKSLMFFHMLRQELGDAVFREGLREFYMKHKFLIAGFGDLRERFESVSKRDLKRQFAQWTAWTGAPQLRVSGVETRKKGEQYILTAVLEQAQPESVYSLRISVAVTMDGHDKAFQTVILMDKKRTKIELALPSRPLRLDIDPEFDLFRRLDREEMPPALSQVFGAEKMLILLPSSSGDRMMDAYRGLAGALEKAGPDDVEIRLDTDMETLPPDRAIVLMGWENRFFDRIGPAVSEYNVSIERSGARIGHIILEKEEHSLVLTARHPENKDLTLAWIASQEPGAVPGLGRKLPHYHKYSYLGFEGTGPENIAKGRWPVLDSPMTVFIPDEGGTIRTIEMGKLADRQPLATLPPVFSKERMMNTVRFLTADHLEGRGYGTAGLERAAAFIATKFREAGLQPAGDLPDSYFETWEDREADFQDPVILKNVVGVIPGRDSEKTRQSFVVGAHYDHLGQGWPEVREERFRGIMHPGADDNASGIAVLIELAEVLAKTLEPERSVVFAAFTGEEAGKKGSAYYIKNQKRYPADTCLGMINLDTVGRLGAGRLLVLGAGSASEWVHIFRGAGYVTGVDLEVVSEELDSSDQKSFHDAGIPAVQLFSGPHLDYHRPSDTADRVDADGLVKVASVAREVIEYLAGREGPMTSMLRPGEGMDVTRKEKRRVSLGTIPDFAFSGRGCRLSGVVPGSPAEACGLRAGDVIIRIGSDEVSSLRDLSDILKSLQPGDRISITFLREGKEMSADARVVER